MGQMRFKVIRRLYQDGTHVGYEDTGRVVSIREEHAEGNNFHKESTDLEYIPEADEIDVEYETCTLCGGSGRVLKEVDAIDPEEGGGDEEVGDEEEGGGEEPEE